jgi:hypothetical protein
MGFFIGHRDDDPVTCLSLELCDGPNLLRVVLVFFFYLKKKDCYCRRLTTQDSLRLYIT